ncbi:MAG: hypothetical protein ACOX8U_11560 [Bradymonadia bacterium]
MFSVLVLIGVAVLLHHFPIQWHDDDETVNATMPPQMGVSPLLLVLPAEGQYAKIYEDLDFSFAWYNLLAQEVGVFNIELSSNINDDYFNGAKIIVIPAKSAASFSDEQIQWTLSAVDKGAVLILEMPTPAWAPVTAIKRKINTSAAIKRFTDAPNSPLSSEFREQLLNTPLDTKVLRIDALDSDTLGNNDLLLELDGAIAHYRRKIGNGTVYVLAFDLGNALTSLQQGKPTDDFHIEKLVEQDYPTPADLVLNEKLKNSTVPYADILKKHVIYSALQSYPLPLLWPFPEKNIAALILTHEENQVGHKALHIAELQEKLGEGSSFFVSSNSMKKDGLAALRKPNIDIGAQLIRPPAGELYSRKGPPFFRALSLAQNLKKQRELLSKNAQLQVTSCKVSQSAWEDDYFTSFQRLAWAGCQIDTSYAPTASKDFGLLFGTAFPFLPIDRSGLPLPVYEFPTLFTDAYPVDELAADAAEQIVAAAAKYSLPAVMNFTADAMLKHPHHSIPTRWVKVLKSTQNLAFWRTNLRQFMQYYSLRRQAQLQTTLNENTLIAELKLPLNSQAYTIALLARYNGLPLQSVTVNDEVIDKDFSTTPEGNLVLVAVPPGDSKITVNWGVSR